MYIHRFVRAVLVVMALLAAGPVAGGPVETVDAYHDSLLKALPETRSVSPKDRFEAFAPVMNAAFDFETMVKTVGGETFRSADEKTKQRMLASFRRMSIALHAERFSELKKATFKDGSERDGPRGLKLVDSTLNPENKDPVALTYVVHQKDGKARIVDVLLKGSISELAVRASEYRKTLQSGGAEAFIKQMDEQTADLLAD